MNNLNSMLIEGNIVVEPVLRTENKNICVFTVSSSRFFKNENEMEEEILQIDIEAEGGWCRMALEKGKMGAELRTVGRLKKAPDSEKIIIVADHIEFRPKIKRSAQKETTKNE